MNQKAVVAGATGLIGKELVHLLLNGQTYSEVTLIVRRNTGIKHPKLRETVLDFNQLEQSEVDLSGADVFCVLGTTIKKAGSQEAFRKVDYMYPLTLGQMAKVKGANQYLIVTSMGANPTSKNFYIRVKGEVEKALQELGLTTLQFFRPSLLLGNREEFRLGERVGAAASRLISPLLIGSLRKYKPIQGETVARAMIHAAENNLTGVHIYESDQIAELGAL